MSDNEPERRVWKLSTRTKPDRGELLYQAPFEIKKRLRSTSTTNDVTTNVDGLYDDETTVENMEWQTIHVPFDQFRLVRGPQVVENGTPLNVSAGIYQLGMTMSQFVFAAATTTTTTTNTTTDQNTAVRIEKTLPNFRDGFFELHIEEMGVYYNTRTTSSNNSIDVVEPESESRPLQNVLSKAETKEQRSVLVKAIFVIANIFISEQSQRRKSALRILQKKYNLTRTQAIVRWGFQRRLVWSTMSPTTTAAIKNESSRNSGVAVMVLRKMSRTISAVVKTISILSIDAMRSILLSFIKLFLFYPIRFVAKTLALFQPNKIKSNDSAITI